VLGSAESVIPVWIEQTSKEERITITHPEMTRFTLTMSQALDFILSCLNLAKGSEIFVPKLKAYTVRDLARAFVSTSSRDISMEVTGLRVGEKDHEMLINEHEMKYAYGSQNGYVIMHNETNAYAGEPISGLIAYSSATAQRHTVQELAEILRHENLVAPN
jgi:UDP-N-acetylglucosamine 4,6-dehydratase/UDP-glucose 4-epimerase